MAFVIKEHRPGRWRAILAAVVFLWVSSAWYTYELGRGRSSSDYTAAVSQHESLRAEADRLRISKSGLQAQVSRLERIAQVDRQAKIELAKQVKDFQDHQAELREELNFYKSIISPDDGMASLRIYSLSVLQAEDQLYHYKLVLTQSGKSDNVAQGGVKMVLKGILQGKEKNLDLREIQVAESRQLSYKFSYFQELSGSFRLPDKYVPREIRVELNPQTGKKSSKPVRTFDWQKARL
jgi:hypothetical protein